MADVIDRTPARFTEHGLAFVDIRRAAARHRRDIVELPFAARILLENIERHRLVGAPGVVEDADVAAIVDWGPAATGRQKVRCCSACAR